MIVNAYSIFDNKALTHGQPFFCPNTPVAIRAVQGAMQDPQSTLGKYPQDFTLYHLGTFDDNTGRFAPYSDIINLGLCSDYLETRHANA